MRLTSINGVAHLIFIIIASLCVGFFLIAYLISSQTILELFLAIFELFWMVLRKFLAVFISLIARLGWYAFGGLTIVLGSLSVATYIYLIKPGVLNNILYRVPSCAELMDRNNTLLDYVCPFNGVRIWKPLAAVDEKLRSLVIMLEDDKFFQHSGLDMDEILNSLGKDLEQNRLARGGSTITQQLAKNLFLTKEKSFFRKILEVPLAYRLEREFDKDQLLELYLNVIEWGPGVFGVEAASRLYFDHEASHLSNEETWFLALIIPNPTALNPWINTEAKKSLLARAKHLSNRLVYEHRMEKKEARKTYENFYVFLEDFRKNKPTLTRGARKYPARWSLNNAFSFSDLAMVKRKAAGLLGGFSQDRKIASTVDRKLQDTLEEIIDSNLRLTEAGSVATLMDGDEIRAIAPLAEATNVPQPVLVLATSKNLKPQVFLAKKIPPSAILQ